MRTTSPPIAIVVILVVSIAVVITLAWRFYRQIPSRRAFLLARSSDVAKWEASIRPEHLSLAQAVLEAVCDAFLFKRTDVWRFRPDDKLRDIYEGIYPPKLALSDSLEYETLFDTLHQEFYVSESRLRELWATEPTLADLITVCGDATVGAGSAEKLP